MSLKISNLANVNTDDWTATGMDINKILLNNITPLQKLYISMSIRVPLEYEVADWSKIEYIVWCGNDYSTRSIMYLFKPVTEKMREYPFSAIFTVPDDYTDDFLYVGTFMIDAAISGAARNCEFNHAMVADMTDLERDYPYFESLPDKSQETILNKIMFLNETSDNMASKQDVGVSLLPAISKEATKQSLLDDAIPYISAGETFEFDGVLRNWINPTNNKTDWSDGVYQSYNIEFFTYRFGNLNIKSIVYGRFSTKYTTDNTATNYQWIRLHADAGNQGYCTINNPLPDKIYIATALHHITELPSGGGQTGLYAGPEQLIQGKTCYWKHVIVLDLYQDGVYLFFRLLGMSDDDIKIYLDSIPFFLDTYSLGPMYLDYNGLQYYNNKIQSQIDELKQQIAALSTQST